MTATAAEIRAWALDQGWELPEKGRLPEEVRHAFTEAAAFEAATFPDTGAADSDGEVSGAGGPPEYASDPEPAKAPKSGKSGPRERRPKVAEAVRKDIRGKTALGLSMLAAALASRVEECGPVAIEIVPDTADALADIFCDSPEVVAFFTTTGGGYMRWIKLAAAVQPLATVAVRHHLFTRKSRGGGPGQGWNGETVPPDMSRYHAPAL